MTWRKSTYSSTGGANCVEVGNAPSPWRKSSHSSSSGGACIEVASFTRSVVIRDTKQDHMGDGRTVLNVTSGAWQAFTASLK